MHSLANYSFYEKRFNTYFKENKNYLITGTNLAVQGFFIL